MLQETFRCVQVNLAFYLEGGSHRKMILPTLGFPTHFCSPIDNTGNAGKVTQQIEGRSHADHHNQATLKPLVFNLLRPEAPLTGLKEPFKQCHLLVYTQFLTTER